MVTIEEWNRHPLFGAEDDQAASGVLSHYTSADRAASVALTGHLILSPLDSMNDPRESVQQRVLVLEDIPGGIREIDQEESDRATEEFHNLRTSVRLACMTQADPIRGLPGSADLASRSFSRSRMWAQYGDNHAGICLLFDRSRLCDAAAERFGDAVLCKEVEYADGWDHLATLLHFPFENRWERFCDKTLFSKGSDWRGESEFRIRVRDWTDGPCVLPLEGLVVGMVLGQSFPEHLVPVAKAIAERFEIVESSGKAMINRGGFLDVIPAHKDERWISWSYEQFLAGDMFDGE